MPRGKYVNHKGRSRHFTSPEELEQESDESSSGAESSSDEEQPRGSGAKPKCAAPAGKMPTSSEESDEDSDDRGAKKGVAGLIEIENPNRAVKKASQKMAKVHLDDDGSSPKPELSRREREQIEKQKVRQRYEKLHAEGKTAQAKADLARLALIRKQRADSAAKREAELKKKTTCEKKPDEMTKSGKVQQD